MFWSSTVRQNGPEEGGKVRVAMTYLEEGKFNFLPLGESCEPGIMRASQELHIIVSHTHTLYETLDLQGKLRILLLRHLQSKEGTLRCLGVEGGTLVPGGEVASPQSGFPPWPSLACSVEHCPTRSKTKCSSCRLGPGLRAGPFP